VTDDELVFNVLVQLDDEPPAKRIRILAACLAAETAMLTPDELIRELIMVRFKLMRINGVLLSERRANHPLEVAFQLVDEQVRELAPEAE
jgi:hypothetical protein